MGRLLRCWRIPARPGLAVKRRQMAGRAPDSCDPRLSVIIEQFRREERRPVAHLDAHDHHADAHRHAGGRIDYGRAFAIGIGLNLGYVVAEATLGVLAGSLALLADAG